MHESVMRQIVRFGERYTKELLGYVSKTYLEADWYGGMSLFLSHSFYQGRRDEVSEKVEWAALMVLDGHFKHAQFAALAQCDFAAVEAELATVIGKGKIGKARDVQMVVGILKFVAELPEENLTGYSIAEIARGNIRKLYNDLMGITQIGPKIASFYLRDLVDIYDLESALKPEDLCFLQPIDTWVRRVAVKTGIINDETLPEDDIRVRIIDACHTHGISAFKFNQGAWFVGKHAFDIVIDHLDDLTIADDRATPSSVSAPGD